MDSSALADQNAVLYALLQKAYDPPGAELAFQPQTDALAPVIFFLLDCSTSICVENFVTITLGRLVQQLSRRTEQQQVEYHAQVRGRVKWPATLKARYSEGVDPTRFVCSEVHHRFDTPENQLLKWLILRFSESLRSVPPVIRQGFCLQPGQPPIPTSVRLGKMEVALANARRSARLNEVSVPDRITEQHSRRAESAAFEDYAQVARLASKYKAQVLSPTWESLRAAGRRSLPLPARLEPAAEPWIRLAAAVLYTPSEPVVQPGPPEVLYNRLA